MNRIAIVTGVSRVKGIGKSICIALAKQNINIFFTYWLDYDRTMPWGVEDTEPEQIQSEIKALGVQCEKLEINLAEETAVSVLLAEVRLKMGNPQILINNATYSTHTTVESLTAEVLDKHYAINLKATTLLTIEFIRHFKYTTGGRIINLISGQHLGKMPNEIAYAITKGAIETLTYTLSSQIAAKGITINAINPGPNDTGWMTEDLKKELLPRFPMKRIGQPKDTANLIAFLVSEEGAWITGQVIHSEGGFIR